MNSQTKYKDEIIKELQDIPNEDMPKLLEIIHCLKTGMNESRKKVRGYEEPQCQSLNCELILDK